ncbi:MAG: hypothetical protein IJN49_08285 [Clostridia bacterium]|nr:hypothetical protein [Clostridia bacterium]
MYDLNLSVPNISTTKYSDDEKFYLLKNYLYELNETLSYALGNLDISNFSTGLKNEINDVKTDVSEIYNLKEEALEKFADLKNKIIITANEIFENCATEIKRSENEIILNAENSFVAKSEFGEYQNKTNASINENSDAIKLNANNIESTVNEFEYYKIQNNADISIQSSAIISQVEDLFAKKSDVEELSEVVSSQITQTSQNITEIFSEKILKVDDNILDLENQISELVYSLDTYIKRGELETGVYGIEIGRSSSNIKARFTNNKLSFMQGETEVAYISQNNLYITRAEITDYLKIGNSDDGYFIFDVSEYGLEVRWSDGS